MRFIHPNTLALLFATAASVSAFVAAPPSKNIARISGGGRNGDAPVSDRGFVPIHHGGATGGGTENRLVGIRAPKVSRTTALAAMNPHILEMAKQVVIACFIKVLLDDSIKKTVLYRDTTEGPIDRLVKSASKLLSSAWLAVKDIADAINTNNTNGTNSTSTGTS